MVPRPTISPRRTGPKAVRKKAHYVSDLRGNPGREESRKRPAGPTPGFMASRAPSCPKFEGGRAWHGDSWCIGLETGPGGKMAVLV